MRDIILDIDAGLYAATERHLAGSGITVDEWATILLLREWKRVFGSARRGRRGKGVRRA